MIQMGTEALQKKRTFTYCYASIYIFKSAIPVINLCIFQYKSTFITVSAVVELEPVNANEFPYWKLQFKERVFKGDSLVRTRSVAANLVTSLEFQSNLLCNYAVPCLAKYVTFP